MVHPVGRCRRARRRPRQPEQNGNARAPAAGRRGRDWEDTMRLGRWARAWFAATRNTPSLRLALICLGLAALAGFGATAGTVAPSGRAVMAWHVTIPPSWFDPSTAPPQITPFGMLYAIHDALVRPYPGHKMGPSLAESWEESEDGLTYQFKLRPGLKFHNGDRLTTEDVKFSFDGQDRGSRHGLRARRR